MPLGRKLYASNNKHRDALPNLRSFGVPNSPNDPHQDKIREMNVFGHGRLPTLVLEHPQKGPNSLELQFDVKSRSRGGSEIQTPNYNYTRI